MATVVFSHKPTGAAYVNIAAIQVLTTDYAASANSMKHGSVWPAVVTGYYCGGSLAKKERLSIEDEYSKPFRKIKNAKARKPRTFSHETIRRHMH